MARKCKKPCPGCGETGCYRNAAEVCNSCRKKLDEHDIYRQAAEEGQAGEREVVLVPGRWFLYPELTSYRELENAFLWMIEKLGIELPVRNKQYSGYDRITTKLLEPKRCYLGSSDQNYGTRVSIPKGAREAVQKFHNLLDTAFDEIFENGRAQGIMEIVEEIGTAADSVAKLEKCFKKHKLTRSAAKKLQEFLGPKR